jgi:hypothetical protein
MLSLQQSSLKPNKNLPKGRIFSFVVIGVIIIGIVILTILNSLNQEEERLQILDAKYRNGQELSESEFKTYCELLEKIWKMHLPVCYCKDGIEKPTPGIEWTNPPKSPEDLGEDWEILVNPKVLIEINRKDYVHKKTKEMIGFDRERIVNGVVIPKHWHRYNPKAIGKNDDYLDMCGKVVARNRRNSHIKIRNLTEWKK